MEPSEKIARKYALKHFKFDEEFDLSYWGSGRDMKAVDDLTATIQRALDEAAAKERAKVVAWFRSPAWQSRHPEDAALARLIGQMIENGEHPHD